MLVPKEFSVEIAESIIISYVRKWSPFSKAQSWLSQHKNLIHGVPITSLHLSVAPPPIILRGRCSFCCCGGVVSTHAWLSPATTFFYPVSGYSPPGSIRSAA